VYRDNQEIQRTITQQYSDTTITPGVLSEYTVAARNVSGIGEPGITTTGWRGLTAPTVFSASKNLADRVVLSWNSSAGATAYKLYTGRSFRPEIDISLVGITESNILSDFTPTFGVGYTYAIKASCALGDSDYANVFPRGSVVQSPPEAAPTGLTATQGTQINQSTVTWNPVTTIQGVSGYKLYKDGAFGGNISSPYIETSLAGVTREFKISAYNKAGQGPLSSGVIGWGKLPPVFGVFASEAEFTDKVNIYWLGAGVPLNTSVVIYGAPNRPSESLQELGRVLVGGDEVFTHTGPTYGTVYKYAVRYSNPVSDGDLSDEFIGYVLQSPPDVVPVISLASNNDAGAVLLEWDVSPTIMGISGYNVYKYDSDLQIKTDVITNPSQQNYIDFDGINGVTYEYKVSAFNLAGEGQLSVGAVGAKAFNPTTLEATKGITTESVGLQWGEISGQNVSYRINRGTSTQTPETIHTTTDLLYTDISASPGVTYEYTVNGFNVAVEGILSNIEIGYRGLTAPVGVTCSNGVYTDRVEISWLPVQGAPQYRVYKGSSFVLLGTTSGITFSDTSIDTIGVTKEYYVSSHIPDVAHESVKSLQTTGWRKLLPPTGMSADKGKLTTGVRITWESAVGATGYKIYKTTDMDPVKETLELLGQTTNTSFTDTNAAADKSFKYYSVKSSCALGDSEYGELDYGYTENLPYTEVISIVPEIYGRYKESVYTAGGLTYISSSPRLIPWSGPLFWNPLTAKEVFEGITAIKGQVTNFGVTYGSNMYDNYVQALYNIGLRGGDSIKNALGSTSSQPVEQRIIKYDSGPWWTDLNGTLGITLRGGTSTRYIRPKTLNELTTKPPPGYRVDALNWINPRNKLLTHLSLISQNILGGNDNVYSNLVWFAGAWRFSLQALTGVTVDKADFPTVYKTDLDARIQSQDYLNVIKTILTEVKNHYPLALPQNGLQDPAKGNAGVNETRTWIGNDLIGSGVSTTQYKGMSGGFRIPSPVIGSATDLDVWSNTTVNTLSPAGLTADQGDYLYDAWNRRYLLNTLYLLEGITTARNPEGISGGQKLSDTASWNSLLTDLRTLLFKELRDHVKQVWERRAWYMVAGSANTGRDYEFNGDVDNWGWVHTNQWMDPLTAIISISMYLYPFAQTSTERQALLSAYNIGSEILAALIERATYSCTSCEDAGIWPEGYGYANQSYPPVLNILDDMKRMGDRRLWDTVSKRGTGISYSCWINNAWKWMQSRIMPNCCIINSGSCDSADYSGGLGNGYHRRAWPMEHAAVLASEYPNPYSKGSALSVYYNRITTTSGLQMMSGQSVFYNRLRLYYETVKNNIPYLDYAKGHYFPDDQTFTWTSQFVDPGLQDDRTNRAYNMNTRTSYTLQAKPFIFGIWGKGSAHFEGKGHRDEGHVSAYMGDAPILLELGEIRADDSITRQYLEKEDGGHNRMQLGGFKKFNWARPAKISGVVLGKTGGSIFMDTTESYNMRSLTAAPSLFNYSWSGPNDYVNIYGTTRVPWGYGPNNSIDEYLYQIAKVTRGISWSYEPYNKVSSYIKITDYMGISGISSGASGPTDRTYYRFHTGASGSTLDTSIGITYAPVSPDKRTWTAGWTAAVKNVITGGYTCDYVGVTMTFSADQPIQIRNRVSAHRSTRDAHNTSPTYGVVGSMANSAVMSPFQLQTLDISLATGFTDERKLNLITEINSTVFRNNTPIVIPTESPLIQNYANYTLGATLSIGNTFGCLTQFKTPCHIFPAWDPEISGYSGISFGRILIDDFSILAAKNGFTLPNALWPSCP
jgi:fibronectin type 3 domain-containing protein